MSRRYFPLSAALARLFPAKVRKIPLDAGFSCPNRDGTLSFGGCLFCNEHGSGTGLYHKGFTLAAQWLALTDRPGMRGRSLLAYLQAFSNTHGPIERLAAVLAEIATLPEVAGLSLGTRPDCLDEEKLDLLAAAPLPYLGLELGLQSANDATLARINRGHTAAGFAEAATTAAGRGLRVTAHVILGLPGETLADCLATIEFVNALPVAGIKLHNLLVAAGAPLASLYAAGRYTPLAREDYAAWVAAALARLRPDIAVERLNADPKPGELIAPAWAADKHGILRDIERRLEEEDLWQGKDLGAGRPGED